jgi:AcrR family transcriptional regulator
VAQIVGPEFLEMRKLKKLMEFPMQATQASEDKLRLVNAARERFMENGFSKVTVDEIAADLKMSKKTVYKFFPSKEDLLRGVLRSVLLYMENRLTRIVQSEDPFETKLANVLALIGGFIRRMRPQFMLDMKRSAPQLWLEAEKFRRERIFPKVNMIFVQAKKEGVLKPDINEELFFLTFLHAMQGIMNPQTLTESSFSADDAFRGVLRILLLGALSSSAEQQYHTVEAILAQTSTSRSL